MINVKTFLLALVVQLVVCATVYHSSESYRYLFTEEDQLVENATALAFLASALVGLWLFTRHGGNGKILLLVIALGLVGFLDELSFGERLFGVSMPSVVGVKVDGVHDLISVPISILRRLLLTWPVTTLLVVFGIACSVAAIALLYRGKLLEHGRFVVRHPTYLALSIFASLIAVAILFDEHIIRFRGFVYLEELLELNAALCLILVASCSYRETRQTVGPMAEKPRPGSRPSIIGTPLGNSVQDDGHPCPSYWQTCFCRTPYKCSRNHSRLFTTLSADAGGPASRTPANRGATASVNR